MDLTTILQAAQSADAVQRQKAEEQIRSLEAQNYPAFLGVLVDELDNEGKPQTTRQLAGLVLKNALSAKEDAQLLAKHEKWKALDAGTKLKVRNTLLHALASQARRLGVLAPRPEF